jgi:hypothetical protein
MNEQRTAVKASPGVLALLTSAVSVSAQLQVLPDSEPQQVFSGTARTISLLISNASDTTATAQVSARLYQASSATTMRLYDASWKTLQMLPRQTIVEAAVLDLPIIDARSRFVIQWVAGTNHVLGRTEVLVYPNNLLKELNPLVADKQLGVFDPQNQLKPSLKSIGVEIADLQDTGMLSFGGNLAIIGPFASREQMEDGLGNKIEAMSKKGIGVVWILPPQRDKNESSFYTVPFDGHATVIVQSALVANLADKPQAQLNLIHFARLALYPKPIRLPELTNEP